LTRATSPSSTVISRSAYERRRAYHSGLRRPAPSTAAHEVTGQQSLSCHTIVPMQYGISARNRCTPKAIARAWLSCV